MKYNDFKKNERVSVVACDTETFTYIDGVKVSSETLLQLGRKHNAKWFREHATISVYAWLVSDGKSFAWLETFEEYCIFMCEHNVNVCWWYNAKFDFAQIDYQLLTNGWLEYNEEMTRDVEKAYSSLHNDKGARYSLKLWYRYKGSGRGANRREHTHAFINLDFCNIFGGGLGNCLKAFNVVDFDGQPVRKLEMDYQTDVITENEINYMKNDVLGLYHLVRTASDFLFDNFGVKLLDKKPFAMTCGGLAKKMLLRHLFQSKNDKMNKQRYRMLARVSISDDELYRKNYLYEGGICFVNERYQNTLVNKIYYRYDVNSMYPNEMYNMYMLIDTPKIISYSDFIKHKNKYNADYQAVYVIDSLDASLKNGYLPVMRDYVNDKSFQPYIHFETQDNINKMWFDFEFEELQKWYNIDYHVKSVYLFKKISVKGFKDYIDKFYTWKNDAKREGNKVKQQFAKLMLNSSYGKLAERCVRVKSHREINEETGAVHLIADGTEIDFKSLLSVVQGALITAQARTHLLQKMRYISNDKPLESIIYCDTDSIHTFNIYDKADAYKLGELKLEDTCNVGKWLAPKTYFEISTTNEIELHTKGIPIHVITNDLINNNGVIKQDGKIIVKDINIINNTFASGKAFQCLCGMNIIGGKALIPLMKELCKESNTIMYNSGGFQEILESEI